MRERVQVGQLRQAPSIRPTATPNVRPVAVAPPKKTVGASILTALSKIEPSLSQYVDGQFDLAVEKEETRALDSINGMTFDEARQAVQRGDLAETETPWFDAAFRKQFGLRYAAERKRQISDSYQNEFDRDTGDIEEFLTSFVNEDAERYGSDEFISAGLREGMSGFLEGVRNTHAQYRSENRQSNASQGFLDVAREAVLQASSKGEDASAAVRALYGPHREMLGVSFAQMDAMTVALAEEFAANGNRDVVNQLLGTTVIGSDGQRVGSFLTRAKWAKQAQRIKANASAKWAENQRAEMFNVMAENQLAASKGELTDDDFAYLGTLVKDKIITPAQATSLKTQNEVAQERLAIAAQNRAIEQGYRSTAAELVHNGRGWAVTDQKYTDAAGKERTLKAADIRQQTVDEAVNSMAERNLPVATIAGTLAGWGIEETFKPWENLLSSGYLGLSSALAKAGDNGDVVLPEAATTAYDLFKQMGETPAFRARHIKDSAALQTFMDAEVLERNGMPLEEALILSSQVDRKRQGNGVSLRIDQSALETAVKSAAKNGSFGKDADNLGYVSDNVERQARIFMALGMDTSSALTEAARRFNESHIFIRGNAINHRNRALPGNFADMVGFAIDEYAALQGEDPAKFSIRPALNSPRNWVIVDLEEGAGILPPNLGANANAFLTLSEITGRWQAKEEARDAKLRADANTSVREDRVERNKQRNDHFDLK